MNRFFLNFLSCPVCQGQLLLYKREFLICHKEQLVYPICSKIPILLKSEAINILEK
ncbi:Trm112 family protein [Candidatus Tachikawaea gelatinosa]|uniref:UPF0434 protein n=1 Tax=Candidatus Tachikawaea gelatinosa TaxID=1410383 RepID=A0A090BWF2_9ENTR|nr:UPF0434 protein [Candidatus Tachikawaea gelatinosa]